MAVFFLLVSTVPLLIMREQRKTSMGLNGVVF